MAVVRSPHAHARVLGVRGALLARRRSRGPPGPGARRAAARPDDRPRAASAARGRRGALRGPARGGRGGGDARAGRGRGRARRGRLRAARRRRRPARGRRSSRAGSCAPANAAAAFASAAHVVRSEHVIPRLAATPMEPRGAIASPEPERLTVWSSSQSAHRPRAQLAQMLGLPESALRVIAPDVGGSFGSKGTLAIETPLVALAALQLGRPVKWAEDRLENFARRAAGPRAAGRGRARAGRRRPHPRPARPAAGRPRRLPPAEHGDAAAHGGDAADRLLRHPGRRRGASRARAPTRCRPRPTAAPAAPRRPI